MKRRFMALLISVVVILSWLSPAMADEAGPRKIVRPIKPGVLEVVFIHNEHPAKGGNGKPTPPPEPKDYTYYQLLGPKWDLVKYPYGIPFTVNPTGAPTGAVDEVEAGFAAWDNVTTASLFGNFAVAGDKWWGQLDGRNNVSWQLITGSPNALAATWIWIADNDNSGTLSAGDEVLETDIVFNTVGKTNWGVDPDGEGSARIKEYDVRNITTHEVGHVVGLDDLYLNKYSELTMYGYASKGETKKISLEIGDTSGTRELYGN